MANPKIGIAEDDEESPATYPGVFKGNTCFLFHQEKDKSSPPKRFSSIYHRDITVKSSLCSLVRFALCDVMLVYKDYACSSILSFQYCLTFLPCNKFLFEAVLILLVCCISLCLCCSQTLDWVDEFPLHCAAVNGNVSAIMTHLQQGKDANQLDTDTWTALHYACW